jgi:hypothetical protein
MDDKMFATPITRMASQKFIPRWLFEYSASTTTIGISRRIVIGQMRTRLGRIASA